MARTKLSDEQKAMIRSLPEREKDKLLLRLIAKDDLLTEQLSYRYLEHEETLDERNRDVRSYYTRQLEAVERTSPGRLLLLLRDGSGRISRHARVTKDKLGEVELFVDMSLLALDRHLTPMRKRFRSPARWIKLGKYLSRRLLTVLKRADKLHPDYYVEFEDKLNDLLTLIHDTPELNQVAEDLELPRYWSPPPEE